MIPIIKYHNERKLKKFQMKVCQVRRKKIQGKMKEIQGKMKVCQVGDKSLSGIYLLFIQRNRIK